MGAQWKEVLDAITASVSNINMKLTHEQKEIFNFHFARVFGRASAIHGNQMKSAVTRIAINIFRIISIIALLRSLNPCCREAKGAANHRKTSCVPC